MVTNTSCGYNALSDCKYNINGCDARIYLASFSIQLSSILRQTYVPGSHAIYLYNDYTRQSHRVRNLRLSSMILIRFDIIPYDILIASGSVYTLFSETSLVSCSIHRRCHPTLNLCQRSHLAIRKQSEILRPDGHGFQLPRINTAEHRFVHQCRLRATRPLPPNAGPLCLHSSYSYAQKCAI